MEGARLTDEMRAAGNVWVIIVNYQTAGMAASCLDSIANQVSVFANLHVVVVDNASPDRSAEQLMERIERRGWRWASVLPLERNGGFAVGNNAGIREGLRSTRDIEYIMLLNPDTLLQDKAIQVLVQFMDTHPEVGIAGTRLEDEKGETQASAHRAHSALGELESSARLGLLTRVLHRYAVSPPGQKTPHECDWVSGASLMIRRKVFEDIGLLDEGYFLYFEEADFCLRARKAGWKVWFVPDASVVHFEGASTGIRSGAHCRPRYWYDSRRRYFVKHHGILGLILADALWAVGRASLTVRRALRLGSGGKGQDPRWFAFDLLWGDLRSIFSGAMRGVSRREARL